MSKLRGKIYQPVMPGLVPGIHVLSSGSEQDVDGRDKPGHDGFVQRECAAISPAPAGGRRSHRRSRPLPCPRGGRCCAGQRRQAAP
ncbi:hypothetical protein E4K64_18040 [Bradyrhizobium frederickii]|uniref:Uncharacterized protein n=1 Tax=Bradyrhizobium frederickii TaxID=2560054 RepID=A0A4Y9P557_9BRAD|nr:hypothetical protein E4K64_18040 [Bradyrhizobium frederickii]